MRFLTETDRIEAFSDGVMAVIITIMVLELRPPDGANARSLLPTLPDLGIYALSFLFVGIYWNNHHHMMRASRGIDGRGMWANLHLLFWLSIVPVSTAWLGRYPTAVWPTALYGVVFLFDAIAYTLLQRALIAVNGADSPFARALAVDTKGYASLLLYVLAIGAAFLSTYVSDAPARDRRVDVARARPPLRTADQHREATVNVTQRQTFPLTTAQPLDNRTHARDALACSYKSCESTVQTRRCARAAASARD